MNQFIRDIIPLLFLMLVYIILFLDQKNNPYNRILKLDLNKSKNTFSSNNNNSNKNNSSNIVFKTIGEKAEEDRIALEKVQEEERIKKLDDINISPSWIRFTRIT